MNNSTHDHRRSTHRSVVHVRIREDVLREGLEHREAHHRSGTTSHRRLDRVVLGGYGQLRVGGGHPILVEVGPRRGVLLRAAHAGYHDGLGGPGGLAPAQRQAAAHARTRAPRTRPRGGV